MPKALSQCMHKEIVNTPIESQFDELKGYLLDHFG